ncbi:MAG: class C sortase [Corynebacterium casei]|uniref:Fimbrial associated sortase n=3 Tax=Corynebacterium casei TaxID=160386 RepID=A0ABN4C865_9CORY|nr:class C sortase [Corynebacterium casei]AHI18774.1 putative fimbrial associated sortase [Corynebacterium casei LMG S-19264]CCE56419.1 putative sortase [Corynebacterium casei UCMA 3821]SLM88664.1 Sortase A, LPXTG specific [Corynebacterium casei]
MTVVEKAGAVKRSTVHKVIPIVLVIAGILVLLYPVAVTYLRNANHASIADAYRNSQTQVPEVDRAAWLERAREYNDTNTNIPILDPWLARVSKENAPYRGYLEQLNPTGDPEAPMATVSIPAIDSKLPLYHGTAAETLQRGLGHLYGSALPVGGEGNHSVLTGHTGLTTATMFDRLDEVVEGDVFYLDVLGEPLKYEVDQIKVVLPNEIDDLQPEEGRDLFTLITCTPYGVNSHRLLVRGTRVPMDEEELEEAFGDGGLWQTWMTWVLILVAIVLLIILVLVLRMLARKRAAYPGEGRHRVR